MNEYGVTPFPIRMKLVKALLIPIFTYCSFLFMDCSRESWNILNKCFNSCLRYIHCLRKYDSLSSVQNSILGCDLETHFKLLACVFIHKLLTTKSPKYLYDILSFPRTRRHKSLKIDIHNYSARKKSFFINGPLIWNSLPDRIKDIESINDFKEKCLHFLKSN